MFKIGEIKMSELAGTAFPELAGREGLLYGVSDPEAPESNSMIYVRTEVADSYTKVRDSIFVTKEEVELPGASRVLCSAEGIHAEESVRCIAGNL